MKYQLMEWLTCLKHSQQSPGKDGRGLHRSFCEPACAITFQYFCFLASQDALEVMRVTDWVTDWLTDWLSVSIDFTDVTLVSDDTFRRLYWCYPDPDDPDKSYLVIKVI